MENTTTFTIQDGKIVETTTTIIEHNSTELLEQLENQLESMIRGRDEYVDTVNGNITDLEKKIADLQQLINL